jgi:hypothetical protein
MNPKQACMLLSAADYALEVLSHCVAPANRRDEAAIAEAKRQLRHALREATGFVYEPEECAEPNGVAIGKASGSAA